MLLSEQTLEEAFPIADRVIVMADGRIVDDGPARAVAARLLRSDLPSAAALPAPVRLSGALGGEGPVPLTIKEARALLAARPELPVSRPSAPREKGRPAVEVKNVRYRYDRQRAGHIARRMPARKLRRAARSARCKRRGQDHPAQNPQRPVQPLARQSPV